MVMFACSWILRNEMEKQRKERGRINTLSNPKTKLGPNV